MFQKKAELGIHSNFTTTRALNDFFWIGKQIMWKMSSQRKKPRGRSREIERDTHSQTVRQMKINEPINILYFRVTLAHVSASGTCKIHTNAHGYLFVKALKSNAKTDPMTSIQDKKKANVSETATTTPTTTVMNEGNKKRTRNYKLRATGEIMFC